MHFKNLLNALANKSLIDNDFETLQTFCDALYFGVYIRETENFNFIFVNEKLANILGYEKKDLLGTNMLMPNVKSVRYDDNSMLKLKQKTNKLQKVKLKSKNGDLITLLHSFNLIQDNQEKYYSVGVLIAANSFEEKKTISFFSSHYEFEDFFSLIKVPTAFVNNKIKQIIYANFAMKDYLQVRNEEKYIEEINSLCFKNDFFRNNYEIFAKEKLDFFEFYADLLDFEYNSNPTVCILNQLPDLDFDLLFLHPVVSANVDFLKMVKSKRTQDIGENLIKSIFFKLVSHEFRTPLTKILLATDLLMNYDERMYREEKVAKFNEIKDTIYDMTKLMEAVMTISRMEQDLFKPEWNSIDLRVFFEMILDGFLVRNNKGLFYNFNYNSLQRFVSIEMTLMTLICNNLIDNATKFSNPNTTIDVNVTIDNDTTLFIEIKDTGIGIPKNEIEMTFKSFFKASNNRDVEGYGLGLFIVKKAVELLKGDVIINSEPNEGTSVAVSIPLPPQSM